MIQTKSDKKNNDQLKELYKALDMTEAEAEEEFEKHMKLCKKIAEDKKKDKVLTRKLRKAFSGGILINIRND